MVWVIQTIIKFGCNSLITITQILSIFSTNTLTSIKYSLIILIKYSHDGAWLLIVSLIILIVVEMYALIHILPFFRLVSQE